jgi:hypothetical protein
MTLKTKQTKTQNCDDLWKAIEGLTEIMEKCVKNLSVVNEQIIQLQEEIELLYGEEH